MQGWMLWGKFRLCFHSTHENQVEIEIAVHYIEHEFTMAPRGTFSLNCSIKSRKSGISNCFRKQEELREKRSHSFILLEFSSSQDRSHSQNLARILDHEGKPKKDRGCVLRGTQARLPGRKCINYLIYHRIILPENVSFSFVSSIFRCMVL